MQYRRYRTAFLACLFLHSLSAVAQTSHATADGQSQGLGQVEQWYRAGQFKQAAEQGLQDLLDAPWNHELRFIVADSLERSGQAEQAMIQFEALDGTPLAGSAVLRLNALRGTAKKSTTPVTGLAMSTLPRVAVPQQAVAVAAIPEPEAPKARPVSTLRGRVQLPPKSPALEQIEALSVKGDYDAVAKQGLIVLAKDKNNHDLRLMVANSLSWVGFLEQAVVQYKLLLNTPVAEEARIGLANTYRWLGQDADALPLYREVLIKTPQNASAQEGVRLAQRALAPRTVVEGGFSIDSSKARRRSLSVDHSFRDASGKRLFEIEVAAVNDELPPTLANERDAAFRVQFQDWLFQPKFEVSAQGNPQRQYFGSVRLQFFNSQNTLEFGRVNWAKAALNARAFDANLTANHVALSYGLRGGLGELSGRFDYFSISDDNEITASSLRLVPAWRPLGNNFRLFAGIETRSAKKPAINSSYYAPVDGFGSGFVGVQGDFAGADWSLFGSAQVGGRLYGEGSNSFSYSAGGKRWLSSDLALGFNLFRLSSSRDNAGYRAKTLNVNVEKLWN